MVTTTVSSRAAGSDHPDTACPLARSASSVSIAPESAYVATVGIEPSAVPRAIWP